MSIKKFIPKPVKLLLRPFIKLFKYLMPIIFFIPVFILCLISRLVNRKFDIGLGPEPLINNIYHKKALILQGYKVETFVNQVYFITSDFDVRGDKFLFPSLRAYIIFIYIIFHYKSIYIYFNGGPLAWTKYKFIEPFLYKLANVKVLVMPYGGDIQDMSKCPNLLFKNSVAKDYPLFQKNSRADIIKRIDMWTKHADHIVSGCDWVYYMYHWDTLTLGHFSIDVENIILPSDMFTRVNTKTIKIFHAPNHKSIKGSKHFIKAVNDLRIEGYDIELVMIQKVSNDEIRRIICECDIVADQLIIGWYAMFALEGMSFGKPVLCYLDNNLIDLYTEEGLIEKDEIPVINCNINNIKDKIKYLVDNRHLIPEIGKRSREYVEKHHSLKVVGELLKCANMKFGINPEGDV